VPKRHPDQHSLADLAAEVLPEDESRVIEAHVIGCPRCAGLLADAERVRRLLRSSDPGPMPDQVWHRIAQALNVEALIDSSPVSAPTRHDPPAEKPEQEFPDEATRPISTRRSFAAPEPPRNERRAPLAASASEPPEASTAQWERFLDSAVPDTDSARTPPPPGPHDSAPTSVIRSVGGKSSRMRSRRQVREEDRHETLLRYVRPVTVAASVLVLAGLSGLFVSRILDRNTADSTASGSMTTASPAPAGVAAQDRGSGSKLTTTAAGGGTGAAESMAVSAGTLTVATGTNYLSKTLAEQARKLTPEAPVATPTSIADTEAEAQRLTPSVIAGNTDLTDPANLARCLEMLKVSSLQPIAIDFARFEGRDAAIIVIAGRDGGYEVWAVARTCGVPGGEGRLAVAGVLPK